MVSKKGHMTELHFGFPFPPGHTMIWASFLFQLLKSLWSWSNRNTYSLYQLSHPILQRTFAKQHQHIKSKTSAVSSFGLLPVSCIKVKYSFYTFRSRQCNLHIDINKCCTSMLLPKIWSTIFQYQFRSDLLIYIYIFVEPFLSAHKLLPQRDCDRRETRNYYGAPLGECHKGLDGRRVAAPVENASRFPSLTKNDAMLFVGLRTANTRFRIIVPLQPSDDRAIWPAAQQV